MMEGMELDREFLKRDKLRKAGKPVEIARTKRLLIRESTQEDVPALYEIWKMPGMSDYVQPMQPTLEEEQSFMRSYIRHQYRFYDFGLWTVTEQDSGHAVGRAGLFLSEILPESVELGYMIAPDCQRRGYAVECGRAIVAYAKEILDLPALHILADCRNLPSAKTAVRLGFTERERIRREGTELIHFMLELTEEETVQSRASLEKEEER